MAHLTYCKPIAPIGDWSTVACVPQPAWFTKMDQQLTKAMNGDGGGTWTPTTKITLGGSGAQVTGQLVASNITAATLQGTLTASGASNGFTAASGTVSSWASGSTLTCNSGSTLNVDGAFSVPGSSSFAGSTTFAGTTWPVTEARSVNRIVPLAISWATLAGVGSPQQHTGVLLCAFRTQGGIVTDAACTSADWFDIPLRKLPDGNTLTSVSVRLSYSKKPISYATFQVVATSLAGLQTGVGSSKTDNTTTDHELVVPVGAVIDTTANQYALRVLMHQPFSLSGAVIMTITGAYATTSVTTMRIQ